MSYLPQFDTIIQRSKDLYYSGKHQEALNLLDQTMLLINNEGAKLAQEGSDVANISQKLEYTSLYFAVQSIFLHNLSVQDTFTLLEQKLEKADRSSDYYFDIKDLIGLSLYYGEMNKQEKDFTKAKTYLLEAFQYRKEHNSELLAFSHFHLGLVYQYSGDTSEALDHFIKADSLSKSEDNYYLQSFTTRHLGFLHKQTDEIEEATRLFELSLRLRLDHNILVYVPFSCITLADMYLDQDHIERAKQLYKQAITIADMIRLDRALALTHLSLAHFEDSQKDKEAAISSYLDSYYFAKKINHEGIMSHIKSKLRLENEENA